MGDIVGNKPAVLLLVPYNQGGDAEQTDVAAVEQAAKRGAPVSLAECSAPACRCRWSVC